MTETASMPLLEHLNDFFCEGANTDAVAGFFNAEEACIANLMQAVAASDEGDVATDSPQALELFGLYRRYGSLVEQLISQFIEQQEKTRPPAPTVEDIAEAIMEELNGPDGATRYLCTAYIAGALDLESFLELAEEMHEMVDYEVEPVAVDA